jgi:hypothetical protein
MAGGESPAIRSKAARELPRVLDRGAGPIFPPSWLRPGALRDHVVRPSSSPSRCSSRRVDVAYARLQRRVGQGLSLSSPPGPLGPPRVTSRNRLARGVERADRGRHRSLRLNGRFQKCRVRLKDAPAGAPGTSWCRRCIIVKTRRKLPALPTNSSEAGETTFTAWLS